MSGGKSFSLSAPILPAHRIGQHEAALWGGGVDVLFQTDKLHALSAYNANGFDIALVQRLLQHSSAATTQRYIGIEPQRIEQAIQNHAQLI